MVNNFLPSQLLVLNYSFIKFVAICYNNNSYFSDIQINFKLQDFIKYS